MFTTRFWMILMVLGLVLAACSPATPSAPSGPVELKVMTHDSFAVSEDLIRGFEAQNNATLVFIKSGDTGAAVNRAVLSKNAPSADVFYGVDNTFLSRALAENIFEAYQSPLLGQVPQSFQLDPSYRALPIDYGDVCINYDIAFFQERGLVVPGSFDDLLKPEYSGLLVVENPATSSPGLAFLLATVSHFGPEGFEEYWRGLRENGVVVVNDWETAYYTNFSASSGKGPQAMVISYGTSPAAEVIFSDPKVDSAPTASITGENMCFRQVEFAGILRGTKQRALAEKFIDFLLSQPFQEDIPLQMFVYPVNANAKLPPEFTLFAQSPDSPAELSPAAIAENREAWIAAWDEVVLR